MAQASLRNPMNVDDMKLERYPILQTLAAKFPGYSFMLDTLLYLEKAFVQSHEEHLAQFNYVTWLQAALGE